ncbi:MAG: hypothetical protein AB9844_10785 [Clostridiaceae bacterium]
MINSSMRAGIIFLITFALVLVCINYDINSEISAKTFARDKTEGQAVCTKTSCSSDDIKQLIDLEGIEIRGIATLEEDGISLVHIEYSGTPTDAKAVFSELGRNENFKSFRNIAIQNEGEYIEIVADMEYLPNNICK